MEIIWDFIRLARHSPPGAAAHDVEAAGVFRAALQQFEELMRAAAAAGPAARPLPLFYALSQAGRAIEAVKGSAGHYGHGLTIDPSADDLMATSIRPVERAATPGQFQTVAAALNSPIISESVSLAAIFASLPETANEILETTAELPRPLSVWPASEPIVPTPGWSHILVAFDQSAQTSEDVSATLRSYPAAKGRLGQSEAIARLPAVPREWSPGGMAVRMLAKGDLDEIAPEYRIYGRRWLRPALVGDALPPSPIMTWWLLLFALSMLARYHPREWVGALQVDSSSAAVSLERALRKAVDALPQLVSGAIYTAPMWLLERDFIGGEAPFV